MTTQRESSRSRSGRDALYVVALDATVYQGVYKSKILVGWWLVFTNYAEMDFYVDWSPLVLIIFAWVCEECVGKTATTTVVTK